MSKTFEEAALELQAAVHNLGRVLAQELRLSALVRWLNARVTR